LRLVPVATTVSVDAAPAVIDVGEAVTELIAGALHVAAGVTVIAGLADWLPQAFDTTTLYCVADCGVTVSGLPEPAKFPFENQAYVSAPPPEPVDAVTDNWNPPEIAVATGVPTVTTGQVLAFTVTITAALSAGIPHWPVTLTQYEVVEEGLTRID
jgi:hypothetical protein